MQSIVRLSHQFAVQTRFGAVRGLSTLSVGNIGAVVKDQRKLLGPRVVIVSAIDERNKDAAGKVWFELQKLGIQSTFLHMKSRFPTVENVIEGVGLVKRTGSTCLVSLGTASVTDFAKAIQVAFELPTGSLRSHLQDATPLSSSLSPRVSHMCFASTPTSLHFQNSCQVLHPEDDVLVEVQGYEPTHISRSPELLPLVEYFSPVVARGVAVAKLFDAAIAFALLNHETPRDQVKELFREAAMKTSMATALKDDPDSTDSVDFLRALKSISDMKGELRKSTAQSRFPDSWPELISLSTMLMETNVTLHRSLPHSFYYLISAGSLLHFSQSESERKRFVSKSDKTIFEAVSTAFSLLEECCALPRDELLRRVTLGLGSIESTVNQSPKSFLAPVNPKKLNAEALTAGGVVEKAAVLLDLSLEKHDELKNLFQSKKLLLKSDLLEEMIEAQLSSDRDA